jgi:Hypothetical protein (DUF2513)
MKIDQDYLKQILSTFENAEKAAIILSGFESQIDEDEEKFIFHMKILEDKKFIVSRDGLENLGFVYGADNYLCFSDNYLRLTAQGHEFIEALNDAKVWESIKTNFKDSSIETLWSVSKQLLEGYAKTKVQDILGIK